jgi:FixJ family two-component response regulator
VPKTKTAELVAIVDDDTAARHALEFLLKVLGHQTASYASAAQFLDADLDAFACLILDHHMPGMTGVELIQQLRSDDRAIPIMLISGDLTPDVKEKASHAGADLISDKPPTQAALVDFIERSLA